jgi:hypothetical protein
VLLTSCDGTAVEESGPRLVEAVVAFPPRDTVRVSLPAKMQRCTDGRAVLIEAVSPEGSGVLVRLRYRDSLVPASYRVIVPSDTANAGATVTMRYLLRDVAHTFSFDSGTVEVRREDQRIAGRIRGSGLENGIRTPTRIDYHDVPLPLATDTVSCAFQP